MRFALLLTLLLSLFTPRAARAEDQAWTAVLGQVALGEGPTGPRLWLDVHNRIGSASTLQIVRPAVGWAFSPGATVHLGYAFIPTWPDEGEPSFEHRVWQQALLSPRLGGSLQLMLRPRLEQRLRLDSAGVGLRLRVFGRAAVPLAGPVSAVVWDEVFWQFNQPEWLSYQGLDQNRLFLGPAIAGPQGVRLELGYLNQWVRRPEGNALNHVLAVNLFLSL